MLVVLSLVQGTLGIMDEGTLDYNDRSSTSISSHQICYRFFFNLIVSGFEWFPSGFYQYLNIDGTSNINLQVWLIKIFNLANLHR